MPSTAASVRDLQTDELVIRLGQQGMVADFGLFALGPASLDAVLAEACRIASAGLQTEFAKVLRFRPASNDLLVIAGIGWHPGVVGHATLDGGMGSPAGYALHTEQPVLSNDLVDEKRFSTPSLLVDHGIHSAINVAIGGTVPFGVLEVDGTLRGEFVVPDIAFLQALANVLAAAVARHETEQAKDELLREKDLLMQEVHHRVKNSLQLVGTLLNLQGRNASDEIRLELEKAAGRIQTISAVHQRLYSGGSVTQTDAAAYLQELVGDMQSMLSDPSAERPIVVKAEPLPLPADQLTPLGLITSELVTNALKHGTGRVQVSLTEAPQGLQVCVEDDGPGFPPEFEARRSCGLGMRLVVALAKGNPKQAVVVDRSAPHGRVLVTIKR